MNIFYIEFCTPFTLVSLYFPFTFDIKYTDGSFC